jgi:di/tricarboxylate transporter
MITILKIIFSILLLWISYVVITTSFESNLFTEWNFLGSIPWMRATLWDFYTNVLVIYLWVAYKEQRILSKLMWLVLLVLLGSIATCAYVLIALFRLKEEEGVRQLISQRHV